FGVKTYQRLCEKGFPKAHVGIGGSPVVVASAMSFTEVRYGNTSEGITSAPLQTSLVGAAASANLGTAVKTHRKSNKCRNFDIGLKGPVCFGRIEILRKDRDL